MHWFRRFQSRWNVSLRATTNRAQEEPERKLVLVRKFHTDIRSAGEFEKKNIANMDQTPLPFDLNVGKTYAEKGSKTVWCRSVGGSVMDKREATVQLTIYADGEPRVKPLIIFRGTGQRITQQEKQQYDHRVTVHFQENAWCDESVFLFWARHMWPRDVATEKLLVIDSQRAQMTARARTALKEECNTAVVYIGGGLTSTLQPLDVLFNKPFKQRVDDLFNEHLSSHLDEYVQGTIPAKTSSCPHDEVGWPGVG
eukprot:scpid75057/ scgid26549/ Pogo transposable element with KRAB domain